MPRHVVTKANNRRGCQGSWSRSRTSRWALAVLAAGGVLVGSCGPELDPITEIRSLRIIAVKKSEPYARPGENVELQMLWEDGASDGPRIGGVSTFFAFWCLNPQGGQFSACLGAEPNAPAKFALNSNRFSVDIPEDALEPSLTDPNLPPNGTAYVFYGVCAGKFSFAGFEVSPEDPPLELEFDELTGGLGGAPMAEDIDQPAVDLPRCVDDSGQQLGSDDFVIGYSTINVYREFRNENPIVLPRFEVNGQPVAIDCVGRDCAGPMDLPDGCGGAQDSSSMGGSGGSGARNDVVCIDACPDDGAETCPEISIKPFIDEASQELDSIALSAYGREIYESIWVSYLIDRGELSAGVKLVNDATSGWNPDYGSSLRAPSEPGPLRIWAVVRDNRGGVQWIRVPAFVR